jgi:hypothetical protein
MATSGEYDLSLTLSDVSERAYAALQIGQDGETLSGSFYNMARDFINLMIKGWENQGIRLWTMKEGTLFLQVGQSVYPFGDASTHLANDYYTTETTAAAAIGASVLLVDDTTGFVNGQPIGVVNEDNDLEWFTISSFVANTSVTLSGTLDVAVEDGAVVYTYANTFVPVLRVLDVRRKQLTDYEIPMNFVSREEYMSLPNKDQPGTAIQAYYSRQIPYGTMYVWNAPSSAVPVIRFTYERKTQIMVDADDTFDLPEEWLEAIIWNLAKRLKSIYGCSQKRAMEIDMMAKETLDNALGFDTDIYPITLNLQRH